VKRVFRKELSIAALPLLVLAMRSMPKTAAQGKHRDGHRAVLCIRGGWAPYGAKSCHIRIRVRGHSRGEQECGGDDERTGRSVC
jgi:hypothetical protein